MKNIDLAVQKKLCEASCQLRGRSTFFFLALNSALGDKFRHRWHLQRSCKSARAVDFIAGRALHTCATYIYIYKNMAYRRTACTHTPGRERQ